ncbi:hypothetical protein ACNKHP_14525 [Shigella boydii]
MLRQRTQLIKRIEGQKLDAADVDKYRVCRVVVVPAPLGHWCGYRDKQRAGHTLTLLVEQRKVHAPGIDPNAIDTNPFLAHLV